MKRSERAKSYFQQGYNCSQAVLLAFADLIDAKEETLLALSKSLGGGLARLRQTCGAVSGMAMAAGALFPEYGKSEIYAFVQDLISKFQQKNGSYNCGELLTGKGIAAENSPNAEARTREYYQKRPCADLVFDAAEILERALVEKNKI